MVEKVVGSMSEWSGTLRDLFRQIDDGSITWEHLQAFLEHRNPFGLRDASSLLADWERFYADVFGITVDFSKLQVPPRKKRFERLIVVAPRMTPQPLYDKCAELFRCGGANHLDEVVRSERTSKDGPYAVWFRDRVEADGDLKNLSANDLKKRNIPGITLEERLLMELKYFKETGNHLDIVNITLCTGSRDSGGKVPEVRWYLGELVVDWFVPGYSAPRLCSRRAVS